MSEKISKAQQKSVQKYIANHYDRILVTVPKGKREIIKEAASKEGKSLNAFILQAINEKVKFM